MLAGSQSSPTDIVCDIIKLEGSAPVATVVGRPLRTSPQLAALANGVAGHAMDFDLNTATQSVTGVIPAILPVAETTGATPSEMLAAFIVAAEGPGFFVLPRRAGGTPAGMAPARLGPPRRQSPVLA
jgi:2-methylcitrate dehydratase PrpD